MKRSGTHFYSYDWHITGKGVRADIALFFIEFPREEIRTAHAIQVEAQ